MSQSEESEDIGTKARIRLSHSQFYAVCSWLMQNKERLQDKPLAYEQAVRLCTKETEIPITVGTLREAMSSTGITWKSPVTSYERTTLVDLTRMVEEVKAGLLEEIASLRKEVERLRANDVWHRGMIRHLYAKLGEEAPQGYDLPPKAPERIVVASSAQRTTSPQDKTQPKAR